MRAVVTGLGILGLLAAPALAQIQTLPETSRSESQVNSLNRQMQSDQQNRAAAQQNQFETNALRNQASRPAPSVALPPPVGIR